MNNLNDTLPSLMDRATENLEPVSTDLLDRSVQQGLRLRRRRTTLLSVTGAGAVLATAGLVAGGIQLLGTPSEASVAGTPVPIVTPTPLAPAAGTPQQALATLKRLIAAPGRTLSEPTVRGGAKEGFIAASYLVDDGNGASFVEVLLAADGTANPCFDSGPGCSTNPDGSSMYSSSDEPEYSDARNEQYGVLLNRVELSYPDDRYIGLVSYNGPAEKGIKHTRAKPLFTADQLATMAQSTSWKFPAHTAVKPMKGDKPSTTRKGR
ncbi:hypothetical protein E0H73_36170 [Kribbella pittospori]|uniref:Uncharacterized protein n=1 Tax=Kribbella pittospori TaxID=722689 RepID=A0A4R0K7E3_9ACTN|nr:hypothetical protein [Kribbella pittospori]TCC55360.1 hypothetical protein E0H73_36170 [Kribbella pittospori]